MNEREKKLLLPRTSRDRPKSAPYLRLKNSKRTSKCQSIGENFYEKNFFLKSHNAEKTEREDPLGFFNIHSVAKIQKKLKGGPFGGFFLKKVAQCRKKSKGGTLWSRPVLYVTRETFLVHFLGPAGTNWRLLKFL